MKALMKTTKSAKPHEVDKKWHIVDATDLVVGRAAVVIANVLRGKHKTSFTPHVDCGDNVVVINADKIRFTSNKAEKKIYYKHTGYAGGIKQITAAKVLEGRFPERVLEKAVERMIPRGPLGREQMRNLRIFAGAEHPHTAQNPETLDIAGMSRKNKGGRIMSDNRQSLSDLGAALTEQREAAATQTDGAVDAYLSGEAVETVQRAPLREQELDKEGRAYATGRRKDAVARVWLKPGSGKITVNGRDQQVYFARPSLRLVINQVFGIAEREGQYDVICTVKGGGLSGQAGAVKHGISQALTKYEPTLRAPVKAAGFLTRDSRTVERKKYGRAKARRSFQFSKR